MAVTSWIRRQFKDGVITTATTTMTNVATSFSVGTGQGVSFPDGSVGPFVVTVDQGQAAEEKILVASRASDTFTVAASGRGYNGTTAQAHTNATVLHTIDAQDLDEANQTAVQTLGAITTSGDLLQGSGANALQRLARGTTGQVLQAGASLLGWVGFAVGQSQAVGAANADGTQTTMCHPDHVHAGVTSFATRQGAVVATTGDYTAAQVTNAADKSAVGQQAFTGEVKAPDFLPAGLTGAVAASRYVGATASGAPTSGTFATGDFVVDQLGTIHVCTSGGTPGAWSSPPMGTLGYAQVTVNQNVTTQVDLTGLTVTVTVGTGRRVRVTGWCKFTNNTANNGTSIYIMEGATQLADSSEYMNGTGGNSYTCVAMAVLTPTGGSHTYKLQGSTIGGGTTSTLLAATTVPCFILVEDIGV